MLNDAHKIDCLEPEHREHPSHTPKKNAALRAELEQQTQEFLARGGKLITIPPTATGYKGGMATTSEPKSQPKPGLPGIRKTPRKKRNGK